MPHFTQCSRNDWCEVEWFLAAAMADKYETNTGLMEQPAPCVYEGFVRAIDY